MAKLKNETQLFQKALQVAENYATQRGYQGFSATDSAKDKTEALYRLLVNDKLMQPLAADQETGPNIKHKLALWIAKQLPADDPLLK